MKRLVYGEVLICGDKYVNTKMIFFQGGQAIWTEELNFFFNFFIYDSRTEREREAETQAEGEAGSMPDVGRDPRTLGSRPGRKAALNH